MKNINLYNEKYKLNLQKCKKSDCDEKIFTKIYSSSKLVTQKY